MKKYISLFAAIAVMISMVGCAGDVGSSEPDVTDGSSVTDSTSGTEGTDASTAGTEGTTAPSTTTYKGMEIVENGVHSEVGEPESKSEAGGFLDGLFGDDADLSIEYTVAEEAADGFVMAGAAADAAPMAPTDGYGDVYIDIEPIMPYEPQPDPQAGLLTGGEWNDNDHWYEWVSLYQTHEDWNIYRDTWRITFDERISVRVTTDDGTPVEGAEVSCDDFSAITDNSGMAYLFVNEDAPETVTVTYKDIEKQLDVTDDELECSLGNLALSNEKFLDLMLMVDTTGSMMDELAYLQAELQDVIQRVAKDNGNLPIRVSVNFYRDEGDEYVVRYYPFTTDIHTAVATIGEQEAMGGGDFPEAVHTALDVALNEHEWDDNAVKLMFFVLDAPPHEDAQIVDQVNSLTAKAASEGIRIIPVASSGIDKSTEYLLRTMAFTTGGTYTFLTDDSGIGGSHIEPTIGEYDVESLNDMMVRIIGEYLE